VNADKQMLNTVCRNLLSNAIKYTPEKGAIEISCEKDGENHYMVTVADSGIGIPPGNMKKLFREHAQFTTLGISHEKGSGLGLVLCKEFVEMNGGKIWAESQVNEGTRFHFTIPAHVPARVGV
jgi:signal transduction histidine kinase